MLVGYEDDGQGLLLVAIGNHDGLVVLRYCEILALGGVLGQLDGSKHVLDALLGAVHVEVTNNDDGLQVGTIPLLVVSTQDFGLEVVHDLHQTNGHAVTRTAVRHQFGQLTGENALHGTGAHAPLFVDDTTLLVNLLGVERQVVAPVMENEQHGVDGGLAGCGYIINVVHRLVDAGVGIELLAKLHAKGLKIANDAILGEVLGTIEAHVLEEMSQTALVVLLLNRTHLLCNVEVCLSLGVLVVTDVVSKPVVKFPDTGVRVDGKRLHSLFQTLCTDKRNYGHQCGTEKKSKFHLLILRPPPQLPPRGEGVFSIWIGDLLLKVNILKLIVISIFPHAFSLPSGRVGKGVLFVRN